MLYNLVNFGILTTKEKKDYYFIDVLLRDSISHSINIKRVFIDVQSYNILNDIISNDIDMFTFDISKYLSFGFNFKNEIALNFYKDLFINDFKQ